MFCLCVASSQVGERTIPVAIRSWSGAASVAMSSARSLKSHLQSLTSPPIWWRDGAPRHFKHPSATPLYPMQAKPKCSGDHPSLPMLRYGVLALPEQSGDVEAERGWTFSTMHLFHSRHIDVSYSVFNDSSIALRGCGGGGLLFMLVYWNSLLGHLMALSHH